MKMINLQLTKNDLNGIPSELLLFVGNLINSKEQTYLYIETTDNAINEFFYKTISAFVGFYKANNISLLTESISSAQTQILPIKLNMFFKASISEKNIKETPALKSFILAYEKMFGVLPYYNSANKFVDKYLFINDVVLKLGVDIILH